MAENINRSAAIADDQLRSQGDDRGEQRPDERLAHAVVGEDLDRRDLADAMQPLVAQLTVEELRALGEQAREARP